MPNFTPPQITPDTSVLGGVATALGNPLGIGTAPDTSQPAPDTSAAPAPTPAWSTATVPDGVVVQSADPDAGKKAATALQALGPGFQLVSVSDNLDKNGALTSYNVIVKNANGDIGAMLVGQNAEVLQAPLQSSGSPLNTPNPGTGAAQTSANAAAENAQTNKQKAQGAEQKIYSSGGNMYTTNPDTGQPVYIGPDNSALAKAQGPHAVGNRIYQWQDGQPNPDGTPGQGTWVDTGPVQATAAEQATIQNAQDRLKLDAQNAAVTAQQKQQEIDLQAKQQGKPTAVGGGGPDQPYITTMDQSGNITATPNPNPPKPTIESGFANAPKIPVISWDPQSKSWQMNWQDNQGREMTQANLWDFFGQLKGAVGNGDGQIPLDTAKAYATAAYQAYDAQTQRMNAQTNQQNSNNSLTSTIAQYADQQQKNAMQGAQTGAGLLQNRVTATSGMLNNVLGQATGNKNLGLGSKLPGGWGAGLVSGIGNFATQMGGGADVYQTAADLVKKANPQLAATQGGQAAAAQLADMLNKYKQATGQDHPLIGGQQQGQPQQPAAPTNAPPAPPPPLPPPNPATSGLMFSPGMPDQPPVIPPTAPGGAPITPNFNMTNF